jgi:hypothetical protein
LNKVKITTPPPPPTHLVLNMHPHLDRTIMTQDANMNPDCVQADTTIPPSELFSEVIDINSKNLNGFFSSAVFAPTIPPQFLLVDPTLATTVSAAVPSTVAPKTSAGTQRFSVSLDATGGSSEERSSSVVLPSTSNNNAGNVDYKSSLLEKYSRNKLKNSLFHNKAAPESAAAVAVGGNRPQPVVGGVPLGANTDIHRSYGGKQLSQADFESQILGVSSATEISVRSMICVKGRCFNADDMSKLIS